MPKETVVTQDLADSPGPPPGNAEPSPSGTIIGSPSSNCCKSPGGNEVQAPIQGINTTLHRATISKTIESSDLSSPV